MAKRSGLGMNLYVAGYDVSNDIGSFKKINGGPAALEVTGIDKLAYERLGGLRDGGMEFVSFLNVATDRAHERFSLLPTTDQILTGCIGTTLGDPAACLIGKQIGYDPTHDKEGALTLDVTALSNAHGLEWGRQLTAGQRTDTEATDGASIDDAAATSFGLQAYLQVFDFTGTSVTVKIQESSDNGVGDAWVDVTGGAFTAATGITSQRIATAADLTVERYLRAVTTGTFTEAIFSVVVVRNYTAVE